MSKTLFTWPAGTNDDVQAVGVLFARGSDDDEEEDEDEDDRDEDENQDDDGDNGNEGDGYSE
jgi:hypothetical protein